MFWFKKLFIIFILVVLSVSCNQKQPVQSVAKAETESESEIDSVEIPEVKLEPIVTETKDLSPVETPEYRQALITFMSGDVFKLENGEWIYVEIGDLLEENDSIKVDIDSFCEIQFGDRAVIRVEENTELALNTVALKPGDAKIGIELITGLVICKVQKLADDDRFNVKTPSVACGVRGTQFSVKVESGADTVLAVKKGAVAILPPELVIEKLVDDAGTNGEAVKTVLDKIEASASVVRANEEINLTETSFKELDSTVSEITKIMDTITSDEGQKEEISKKTVDALTSAVKIVIEKTEEPPVLVKELSVENVAKLKSTEDMRMLNIPVVLVTTQESNGASSESSVTKPVPPVSLHKFSLKVIPSSAQIILDSKTVGTGSFSGIFEEGETLNFKFEGKNYESQSMSFTVSRETSRQYTVTLAENKKDTQTKSQNIEPVKTDTETQKEEQEQSIPIEEEKVVESKVETVKQEVVVKEVSMDKAPVTEKPVVPKLFTVNVKIDPLDSNLFINGDKIGSSTFSGKFPEGTKLEISGSRNGFNNKSMLLSVGDKDLDSVSLKLEPHPVEFVLPVTGNKLVGSVSSGNNMFYSSDSHGVINAVSANGRLVWTVKTENKSVENSYPVFSNNKVYFSGSSEFIILNAANGKIVARETLNKNSAHIFGRRVVPMGSEDLFPANEEIRVIDRNNGNIVRSISLPGNGSRMTPAVWKTKILSVDQNGTLSIINAGNGSVEKEVSTGGSQPIAMSITIKNDLAVFSGRKGNVVCVDLNAGNVLWEKQLNGNGSRVQVYSDILCSNTGAYVYTKGIIFALDLKTGKDLFKSINNVSAPPSLIQKELVFGNTDRKLIFMDADSGNIKKTLTLDNDVSTRPAELNGKICVGINGGKIVVINPEGIR